MYNNMKEMILHKFTSASNTVINQNLIYVILENGKVMLNSK